MQDATAQLRRRPNLYALFRDNVGVSGNLTTFGQFIDVVAELQADPFRIWSHAASWIRGSAELGVPVWFSTLEGVLSNQTKLLRLLGAPNASMPELVLEPRRNASGRQRWPIPDEVAWLYNDIHVRLLEALEGTCVALNNASMYAHQYVI